MKRFLQICVTVGLILFIFLKADLSSVAESLRNANYFGLALALCLVLINRCLMGIKWNLLLKAKNIPLSIVETIKIYFISNFLGLFLVPTVGMDAVRSYMVKKKNYPLADILATIFVERLLGLLVILVYGMLGIILFVTNMKNVELDLVSLLLSASGLFCFFVVSFMLSLNPSVNAFILRAFSQIKRVKVFALLADKLEKFYRAYYMYHEKKGVLVKFILLTFFEASFVIFWAYLISWSLHADVPFIYFLSIVPVVTILIRIPITIAGFGVHEGTYVYFLSLLGFSKSLGLAIGMIDHLIIILGFLPGGIFLLMDSSVNKDDYRKGTLDVPHKPDKSI